MFWPLRKSFLLDWPLVISLSSPLNLLIPPSALHASSRVIFHESLFSASIIQRTPTVSLRNIMSAMSLRQLKDFVPIFFISPLLRVQFMPPSRIVFELRFLLEIGLYLLSKCRRAFLNDLVRIPPVKFPPGPEPGKYQCDHDNWDYDANSYFLLCDMSSWLVGGR